MRVDLAKCAEVQPGVENEVTVTSDPIANGKTVTMLHAQGSAVFSANTAVLFEFGSGETWEPIWSIKGEMPIQRSVPVGVGDGTKVFRIRLSNGEAGPVYMSGYCSLLVED
jgi:hypothetical protein